MKCRLPSYFDAGYEQAGQLTEAIYRRPYSVLLFNEIEKAHPRICDLLLQILDDGCLTDAHGKVVDFKHTLIILSTNIGASHIERRSLAFTNAEQERGAGAGEHICLQVMPLLKDLFKPELFNRIDEIVPFHSQEQAITLQVTDEARCLLVRHGYDPAYGARPLRGAVQRMLEDLLAEAILQAAFSPGDTVVVSPANEQLLAQVRVDKVGKGRPAA